MSIGMVVKTIIQFMYLFEYADTKHNGKYMAKVRSL